MKNGPWKVGELANATGLTVRALHHYDEIGLLRPSHHTESGHRLYGQDHLIRLQRIQALRQLGFALGDIAACLSQPAYAPLPLLRLYREKIEDQMKEQEKLLRQLRALEGSLAGGGEPTTERLLDIMAGMAMVEK